VRFCNQNKKSLKSLIEEFLIEIFLGIDKNDLFMIRIFDEIEVK
jgi:hypothetical protein